jgi:hypothetical protein
LIIILGFFPVLKDLKMIYVVFLIIVVLFLLSWLYSKILKFAVNEILKKIILYFDSENTNLDIFELNSELNFKIESIKKNYMEYSKQTKELNSDNSIIKEKNMEFQEKYANLKSEYEIYKNKVNLRFDKLNKNFDFFEKSSSEFIDFVDDFSDMLNKIFSKVTMLKIDFEKFQRNDRLYDEYIVFFSNLKNQLIEFQKSFETTEILISKISYLIGQMEIVALNSSIESSKVLDSDNSFSIIADEMQSLAQKFSNDFLNLRQNFSEQKKTIFEIEINKIEKISDYCNTKNKEHKKIELNDAKELNDIINELNRKVSSIIQLKKTVINLLNHKNLFGNIEN